MALHELCNCHLNLSIRLDPAASSLEIYNKDLENLNEEDICFSSEWSKEALRRIDDTINELVSALNH